MMKMQNKEILYEFTYFILKSEQGSILFKSIFQIWFFSFLYILQILFFCTNEDNIVCKSENANHLIDLQAFDLFLCSFVSFRVCVFFSLYLSFAGTDNAYMFKCSLFTTSLGSSILVCYQDYLYLCSRYSPHSHCGSVKCLALNEFINCEHYECMC